MAFEKKRALTCIILAFAWSVAACGNSVKTVDESIGSGNGGAGGGGGASGASGATAGSGANGATAGKAGWAGTTVSGGGSSASATGGQFGAGAGAGQGGGGDAGAAGSAPKGGGGVLAGTSGAGGSGASGGKLAGTAGAGGKAGASGAGGIGGSGGTAGTGGRAPVTCTGRGLQPGDYDTPMAFSGVNRNYLLHVPPGYTHTRPVPLVLNIHAYSSDATYQETSSNMDATADTNGFVVAYPNSDTGSWNAGACCGESRDANNDDVQFFRNVVADIESKICVDPSRIYATGMSNGGFTSHYVGCNASDLFAAIAPVSGMLGIANEDCKPKRPVPVYYVHGDADPVVPFNGGSWLLGPDLMSADQAVAGWVARNHCKDAKPDVTKTVGNTTCSTYHECDQGVEVTFCVVSDGGHCWPGMQPPCEWFSGLVPGGTIPDLKGSEEIWKFFNKYSL